jgi:hypothetical protein
VAAGGKIFQKRFYPITVWRTKRAVLLARGLLGFEPQLLGHRLAVKVYVRRANLIALNLSEGSRWKSKVRPVAGVPSKYGRVWVPCNTHWVEIKKYRSRWVFWILWRFPSSLHRRLIKLEPLSARFSRYWAFLP